MQLTRNWSIARFLPFQKILLSCARTYFNSVSSNVGFVGLLFISVYYPHLISWRGQLNCRVTEVWNVIPTMLKHISFLSQQIILCQLTKFEFLSLQSILTISRMQPIAVCEYKAKT